MSWARGIFAATTIAAATVIAPAAAMAGVVVASSGPSAGSWPVGKQVGTNDRIVLRDGDSVTVLDDGGTRVFRGAGTYMLSQASGASRSRAFASLTTQRSASRARTGAVRSTAATEVTNPSLWYVDVAASGTICLPSSDNIRLWRADTQAESTYAIAADGGSSTSVTFPAGEMLAAWDIYNLPEAGTTYRIGHGAGAEGVAVNFVFLDEVPASAEGMASALIANGCMTQLAQMSNAMLD